MTYVKAKGHHGGRLGNLDADRDKGPLWSERRDVPHPAFAARALAAEPVPTGRLITGKMQHWPI